ncbi:MAG TPA: hypothetical protein VGQ00_04615 [Candidatus Norongarragalinales archaeon]|nr:hypothetical protein [Candidatus Norongarragalinales archaeon]
MAKEEKLAKRLNAGLIARMQTLPSEWRHSFIIHQTNWAEGKAKEISDHYKTEEIEDYLAHANFPAPPAKKHETETEKRQRLAAALKMHIFTKLE